MLYWHGADSQCAVYVTYMFKQANRWAFPPKYACCDGGSGQRKWTRHEHRWKQAGSLCSPPPPTSPHPPSFMYQQHMGAKWGQCTSHVFARTHTRLDRQSWPGDEEEGDASINRCLMLLFWRGLCFFSLPFEIHGFVCAVVLHVWPRNALPFWQLFIYLQVLGVRGPGASGAWAEGLTSLDWLCGLNVDPLGFCFTVSSCCSVVACGAMSTTPSAKSIPRTQWRGDSTSGINLCLAGMENK